MTTASVTLTLGVAPWAPDDLAGIAAWYKADAITGVADGGTIATWEDSYGSTDLVQATEEFKPLYQTNELNGLPAVHMVDQGDHVANSLNAGSQPFTVFAVARPTASWTNANDVCGQSAGNWRIGFNSDGNDARMYAGSVLAINTNLLVLETAYVFTGLFNGASSVLRVNSGLGTTTGNAGAAAFGTAFVCPGPSRTGGQLHVFEVIAYSGDKTASFGTVESYLAAKWGITLT